MTNHFSMCKKVDQLHSIIPSAPNRSSSISSTIINDNSDENKFSHKFFDVNSSEDRTLLSELLIHTADISGQSISIYIYSF